MSYAAVDIALLVSEFDATGLCPVCIGPRHHHPACAMDQGLSERGFCTQAERDVARARIFAATGATQPPPPGGST